MSLHDSSNFFLLLLTCTVFTLAIPQSALLSHEASPVEEVEAPGCTNGPWSRKCWEEGFDINTDYEADPPDVPDGIQRTYNLELTNVSSFSPDGVSRPAMLVNDRYPGPTIFANWGDTVIVNVKNSLENNGTSIHWHGVRQLDSNQMDGSNGATECPIAPGQTKQYKFRVTQYGTSWYHSHHSVQYGDGVLGMIQFEGPATADYDEDLGVLPITDWYYTPSFTLNDQAQHGRAGFGPLPDNILVNGTHKNAEGGGKYFKMIVERGKTYRLRIINTAMDSFFHVSLDDHEFTVISNDFVPIKPYTTKQLAINIGQRYDVIINATQEVGNYWLRVNMGFCSANKITESNIVPGAIFSYDGAPDEEPTTSGVTPSNGCDDETDLVPWLSEGVPSSLLSDEIERLGIAVTEKGDRRARKRQDAGQRPEFEDEDDREGDHGDNESSNLVRWLINNSSLDVDWERPTLQYVIDGDTDYQKRQNVYLTSNADEWYYWWLQMDSRMPLPHPIHLHGHNFYLLGSGAGEWDGSLDVLNFENPTRRDTCTIQGAGYVILAFKADNPGAWLMHCHIAFHASQGFSIQFLERRSDILDAIGDLSGFEEGCSTWKDYWNGPNAYPDLDSGI